MDNPKFHYQNRLLENIKGEKWKDIPALEGYFMISDHGRVKRMEYELPFADGRLYQMKSRIMKPTLAKSQNHFKNDNTCFLKITLTLAKKIYNFSIARMVYYCFVSKFKWDEENLMVVCKDGDGRNMQVSNLKLVTRSERQLRMIHAKRSENILLRPSIRDKMSIAIREQFGKQVSQYDKLGRRINIYPTIRAASEAVGVTRSSVSSVLRGRKISAGGYFWRYGTAKKIDILTFLEDRKSRNKTFIGKSISQYNMRGSKIAVFRSISEASRKTFIEPNSIGRVVSGKTKSAGGFFWKKGNGKDKIDLAGYSYGYGSGNKLRRKKVRQFTLKGKYVRTFDSLTEAAAFMGLKPGGLSSTCKGTQKTCGGYKWAYTK